MGGMIAIAFTAKYPEKTIAACADVAFAKCDVYRRTLFRVWRRMAETMPWDEFTGPVRRGGPRSSSRASTATSSNWSTPAAMENMDLTAGAGILHEPAGPPPCPSGLGAWKMAEMNGHIELVEFPDIGHADLVECSDDAVRIVSEFFERALVPA